MTGESKLRRQVLHGFLSQEECEELEFIHKSCSAVGYRPYVLSTTLSHLIATNCAQFIIPFVPIRERLKDKVEELFGCEFELCIEFTGLVSWVRGASIGWHSDDNRPYLKQREFTAVCYLNSHGEDFTGGLLHFKDGEPISIVPIAGDAAIYTADSSNTHSVDEVTGGERLTLTLWFTRDGAHNEDVKLISLLSNKMPGSSLPLPPPSGHMYWFSSSPGSSQQCGFNLCCARLSVLGFDVHSPLQYDSSLDLTQLLLEPVQLGRGSQLFKQQFINVLHALQVVQFYFYSQKGADPETLQLESSKSSGACVAPLSDVQEEASLALKSHVLQDCELAQTLFAPLASHHDQFSGNSFSWARFAAAVAEWEEHGSRLLNELMASLPYWRVEQLMYTLF